MSSQIPLIEYNVSGAINLELGFWYHMTSIPFILRVVHTDKDSVAR